MHDILKSASGKRTKHHISEAYDHRQVIIKWQEVIYQLRVEFKKINPVLYDRPNERIHLRRSELNRRKTKLRTRFLRILNYSV